MFNYIIIMFALSLVSAFILGYATHKLQKEWRNDWLIQKLFHPKKKGCYECIKILGESQKINKIYNAVETPK